MAERARILIVDDIETNRDVLKRQLARLGHDTRTVEGGREALDTLAREPHDLVLLDIMMPGMDGFAVLSALKADPALREIPVVMISAITEMESIARCIEMGAEDFLPKPFNPLVLRARVGASLDRKKLRDRERLYAQSLERELTIGRQIQAGFLPETLPSLPGFDIAARFEPARQVAGDFYDAFPLPTGGVALLVADVCDKGVGAALYMALFRSLFRALAASAAEGGHPPGDVLAGTTSRVSDYIAVTHEKAGMFATAFFAHLAPDGTLVYLNAGHEPPFVASPGRSLRRLAPTGPAVGLMPGLSWTVESTSLEPRELLLVFTDGVTEAKGGDGHFGEQRLATLLAEAPTSAPELLRRVDAAMAAHVGPFERSDDVTLLAVRREEPGTETVRGA